MSARSSLVLPISLPHVEQPRLAYIKPMRSEEVAFLCAEAPLLQAGRKVFVLQGTDGMPILLADSREAVLADAARLRLETVSLH
jgi:hypothetical protein